MKLIVLMAAIGLVVGCASSSKPRPADLTAFVQTASIGQAWQASASGRIDYPAQLAVAGQQVALASAAGSIAVLSSANGADLWRFKLGQDLSSGVGFDGQTLAVTTVGNELVVVQPAAQTGKVAWRQLLKSRVFTPPLVAGGRIFVLLGNRQVQAFDAQTGTSLWTLNRPSEPLVLSQAGTLGVYKNTLIVGGSGRMLAVNPDNGQILWETAVAVTRATNDIERLNDLVGQPHREGDSICVRAYQASVACVDASKGQTQWTKAAQGAVGVSGDAQSVVSTESNGRVRLWSRQSGETIWTIESLAHRNLSAPLLVGNSIVVGDYEGYVHVINKANGSFTARFKTDGSAVTTAPLLVGTTVIVATAKGGIFAFSPK